MRNRWESVRGRGILQRGGDDAVCAGAAGEDVAAAAFAAAGIISPGDLKAQPVVRSS